jgi:hypothetical protein
LRRIALAAAALALIQGAVHWRLWTPIQGAHRFLVVALSPLPLYGLAWPIAHAFVLALGVWIWTRERTPRGAPLAAAIASFALLADPEVGVALGVAWIPWCLWAAERFAKTREPRWGAVAALAIALAIAGGVTPPVSTWSLARLPILGLGLVPILAALAARSRRALVLGVAALAAVLLGRPSLAVIFGAGAAAEGVEAPRGAKLSVALGVAIAIAAAVVTAWTSHLPNRPEAVRDLAALVFAEAAVAAWALWQTAHDERRVFPVILAAVAALTLWFDHHDRLERVYRRRPSQSPIAINVSSSTPASTR